MASFSTKDHHGKLKKPCFQTENKPHLLFLLTQRQHANDANLFITRKCFFRQTVNCSFYFGNKLKGMKEILYITLKRNRRKQLFTSLGFIHPQHDTYNKAMRKTMKFIYTISPNTERSQFNFYVNYFK